MLLLPTLFFSLSLSFILAQNDDAKGADEEIAAVAQHNNETLTVFEKWQAGSVVSDADVARWGVDRCFEACPISNEVFARMKGKSYKSYCTLPISRLRYLKVLHRNAEGRAQLGELVCNCDVADDLISIFKALYKANYRIERMVLIDNYNADDEASMNANNTSCFNCRYIAGTKRFSNHSSGRAIDINPFYNPYVYHDKRGHLVVSPSKAQPYANRNKAFMYKIDKNDLCYRLFVEHGFRWGGSWKRRIDYQHFEKQ